MNIEDSFVVFAKGFSMYPALKPGDQIVFSRTFDLIPGEIYCYRSNSMLVTHRFLFTSGENAFFQGDSLVAGEWIPQKTIEGRLLRAIRNGKVFTPASRPKFRLVYHFAIRMRLGLWRLKKLISQTCFLSVSKF